MSVTDKFSVTAGLRYYHFKEDKEQIFDGIFGAGSDGKPQSQPGSTKADGVAPRFIARTASTGPRSTSSVLAHDSGVLKVDENTTLCIAVNPDSPASPDSANPDISR